MAIPRRTSLRSVNTAVAVRVRRACWMRVGAQSKISTVSDSGLLRVDFGFDRLLSRKATSFLARAIRLRSPAIAPML